MQYNNGNTNNYKKYYFGADDFYISTDDQQILYSLAERKHDQASQIKDKKQRILYNRIKGEKKSKQKNLIKISQQTAGASVSGGITNNTSGTYKTTKSIENIGSAKAFYLMSEFESGNVCSPVAATNIMRYWSVNRGYTECIPYPNYSIEGAKRAFGRLKSLMGTSSSNGTSTNKIASGLRSYIRERKYSASVDEYWYNWWSDYTRDIKKNLPILVSVFTNEGMGHSVFAFGYVETTVGKYLEVYDGWYDTTRYLRFDGYYDTMKGMSVKVS